MCSTVRLKGLLWGAGGGGGQAAPAGTPLQQIGVAAPVYACSSVGLTRPGFPPLFVCLFFFQEKPEIQLFR